MKRPNIQRCRTLRKQQTDAEKKLWKILRARQLTGAKFRRQFSIGHYILDFYSPKYKLGIETDGGQHYQEEGKYKDRIRTANLQKTGVAILRFGDSDILNNIEGVWEIICRDLDKKKTLLPHTSPPQPAPSPPREKE